MLRALIKDNVIIQASKWAPCSMVADPIDQLRVSGSTLLWVEWLQNSCQMQVVQFI